MIIGAVLRSVDVFLDIEVSVGRKADGVRALQTCISVHAVNLCRCLEAESNGEGLERLMGEHRSFDRRLFREWSFVSEVMVEILLLSIGGHEDHFVVIDRWRCLVTVEDVCESHSQVERRSFGGRDFC